MSKPRTLTHPNTGPVRLNVHADTSRITIVADPNCRNAEVTVAPYGSGGAAVDALLARVTLASDPYRNMITVKVPDAPGSSGGMNVVSAGDMMIGSISGNGSTMIQSGSERSIINGRVYNGPVTIINGNVVSGGGYVDTEDLRLDVTARVPVGSSLDIRASYGNVTATGRYEQIRHSSTSGSVDIDYAANADARTSSGAIRISTASSVDASSSSGSIQVGSAWQILANASSGSISVKRLGGHARATTASGAIDIHAVASGTIRATSSSGAVTISKDPGLDVEVDARATSGRVRTPSNS